MWYKIVLSFYNLPIIVPCKITSLLNEGLKHTFFHYSVTCFEQNCSPESHSVVPWEQSHFCDTMACVDCCCLYKYFTPNLLMSTSDVTEWWTSCWRVPYHFSADVTNNLLHYYECTWVLYLYYIVWNRTKLWVIDGIIVNQYHLVLMQLWDFHLVCFLLCSHIHVQNYC